MAGRSSLVALLVLCLLPAVALGDVRSGSVSDPLEFQRPSLDGSVIDEVVAASAAYDDQSGTVTVALTLNQPRSYGDPDGTFVLSRCTRGVSTLTGRPSGPAPPELTISISSYLSYAHLEGYDGSVELTPVVTDGGRTVTATVSHPLFAHRDWRCVDGTSETGDFDDDDFAFHFAGYQPIPLSASVATTQLGALLQRRFAADWAASRPPWVRCPAEEVFRGNRTEPPIAYCRFELRTAAGRYRTGGAFVTVEDLTYGVELYALHTYDKRLRSCPRARLGDQTYANRVRIVDRWMRSSAFVGCDALMASDVDYAAHRRFPGALGRHLTTFVHGTNTAGFGAQLHYS